MQSKLSRKMEEGLEYSWLFLVAGGDDGMKRKWCNEKMCGLYI